MWRERLRQFVWRNEPESAGILPQNIRNHILIFFRFERTRRIHEPATEREVCERHLNHPRLQLMKLGELFRAKPPANFRMPCESSGAGARRVHQNPVELDPEGKRARGVQLD